MNPRTARIVLLFFVVYSINSLASTQTHLAEVANATNVAKESPAVIELADLSNHSQLKTNDAVIKDSRSQPDFLHVIAGTSKPWPGVTIKPADKDYWNLARYLEITLTVKNLDTTPLTLFLRADSPLLTNKKLRPWSTARITIPALKTRSIHLKLKQQKASISKLIGMRKLPHGMSETGFDAHKVSKLVVFVKRSSTSRTFEIGNLKAMGDYNHMPWMNLSKKEFFPFVDRFGQFKHANWPNKVLSIDDLKAQREFEVNELKQHLRPGNWNKYGGWINGPRFKPTQHFRVKKVDNKWWFIDPEGYLFWSHGVDVVRNTQLTIVTDREEYFSNLADNTLYFENLFANLKRHQVKKGYYKARDKLKAYDFFQSNLMIKYGLDWKQTVNRLIHKRLASWGLNTIGLWSANEITSMGKTPYVEWLYYRAPKIVGKGKYKTNMVDMWDSGFIVQLEKTKGKLNRLKEDAWCIGVFVDNELPWGDAKSFVAMILSAPAKQPAKVKFIEFLVQKYKAIDEFNQHWNTNFGTWAALDVPVILNDVDIPWDIASEFYRMSAEQYYKSIRKFIKQHAPDILYLGSRLNGEFPIPATAAAKYADVVSYNLYRTDVGDFAPPDSIDKPILIGEWHFGSNDRGVFGSGLVHADNQQDRAKKYKHYLKSALVNPYIIGAHWFQYIDQPLTGRTLDEENYQIGFISITDTPYYETIEASRNVGAKIYSIRGNSE